MAEMNTDAAYIEAMSELERLNRDKQRLDWLADPTNPIGNVQLPRGVVERNLGCLRSAIDEAMRIK